VATVNNISIYKGEAVQLNFTMSPVTDISSWTIALTIRVNASDTGFVYQDATAIHDSDVAGTFHFLLAHAATNIASGTYAYDVQRTDAGSEAVLSIGILTIAQEVYYY
jgi:hypothetical protein